MKKNSAMKNSFLKVLSQFTWWTRIGALIGQLRLLSWTCMDLFYGSTIPVGRFTTSIMGPMGISHLFYIRWVFTDLYHGKSIILTTILGETVVTFSKSKFSSWNNHLAAIFDVSNFSCLKIYICLASFWWLPVTLTQTSLDPCDIFILICQLC